MQTQEQQFGMDSESIAVNYLKEHGYQIIKRNYRTKFGEIDIIAKDGDTIVFAEVKARKTRVYNPKEAVTKSKKRKISMVALYYLKTTRQTNVRARFDVVAIDSGNGSRSVEILKNAFELTYG
ncbi:MAG: YraN family protein [Desulfobacterales bacterium]|jgi:putative endonuclease|nr:YraN family protein [Desulfobacterales bacterium]